MSEHIMRRLKEQTPYTNVLDGELMKEAADEITRLRGQVEALNAERDRLWAEKLKTQGEIERLREENARLREALKPFAEAAEELDEKDKDNWNIWEHWITYVIEIGHLRAAAAAIRETSK